MVSPARVVEKRVFGVGVHYGLMLYVSAIHLRGTTFCDRRRDAAIQLPVDCQYWAPNGSRAHRRKMALRRLRFAVLQLHAR